VVFVGGNCRVSSSERLSRLVKADKRLLNDCKGQMNALIPTSLFSRVHGDILRNHSFDTLIKMRDRIWLVLFFFALSVRESR
jgi:hypothetical protein